MTSAVCKLLLALAERRPRPNCLKLHKKGENTHTPKLTATALPEMIASEVSFFFSHLPLFTHAFPPPPRLTTTNNNTTHIPIPHCLSASFSHARTVEGRLPDMCREGGTGRGGAEARSGFNDIKHGFYAQ